MDDFVVVKPNIFEIRDFSGYLWNNTGLTYRVSDSHCDVQHGRIKSSDADMRFCHLPDSEIVLFGHINLTHFYTESFSQVY